MKEQEAVQSNPPNNLQGYTLQVVVVVLTILLVLFGLLAGTFMLGLVMLIAHGFVSAFLVRAIMLGDQKRKDFAIACVIPNIAGYVFATGGLFGIWRWLFLSAMIFAILGIVGLGRRVMLLSLSENSFIARIPLVGPWVVPTKPTPSPPESVMVDDPFESAQVSEDSSKEVETTG